jgi:hypothetical protein
MKTKITTFIFAYLFSFALTAQEKSIAWDYPVKPGGDQWAAFTTGQQMLDACQIPQKILNALNTKELTEICLNYPLFFEYLALDNEREGINIMIENFNGLNELSKREDGTAELIKLYKEFPIITKVQDVKSVNYHTPYKLPFLELLISDNIFIDKLNDNELLELGKIVLDRYEKKVENLKIYSLYNIKRTFLLGSVILDKQNKSTKTQQSIIKNFIENFNNANEELLTEISNIISQL